MLAVLLALPGCLGLSEDEQRKLDFFLENSQSYFERGDYQRALHQADMALGLDADLIEMRLVRAYSLLHLGRPSRNAQQIRASLAEFQALAETSAGAADHRVAMGLGGAYLARARDLESEIALAEQRASSVFLPESGRLAEDAALLALRAQHQQQLASAEHELLRALSFDRQGENLPVLLDLLLVQSQLPDRDAEIFATADRALTLLDESARLAATTLERSPKLPPAARVELQQRLQADRDQEIRLRDLVATVHGRRGDWAAYVQQMDQLAAKDLLGEAQCYGRAGAHEQLGNVDAAIADLETVLKLRSRRLEYDRDELAPELFRRLAELRARRTAP
ncbi:MAG: hypothetical protein ACT4PU_13615 [Planctomycetota bacterium]